MSTTEQAFVHAGSDDTLTNTVEEPELRLVWPQSGVELDLAVIQGLWTEEMYLRLTDQTHAPIEFTDGMLEILPMPTRTHQMILAFLYEHFVSFVRPRGGVALFSGLRLRIRPGKYREPDLLLLLDRNDPRNEEEYWTGADLTLEIVSPNKPERDLVVKRSDYTEAGVSEYWIVNPMDETVTVLTLADGQYVEHGVFARGALATSRLLEGFAVDVDTVFDAR